MELPQINNKLVAHSAAAKHVPTHAQTREGTADEKSAGNTLQGSRKPPLLPCSALPVRYHHHRRRPSEARQYAAPTLPPPSRHPATFPDMSYSSRQSSHRPGLSFFEYVPSRAVISMATTVVFLGPAAAKRVRMCCNHFQATRPSLSKKIL